MLAAKCRRSMCTLTFRLISHLSGLTDTNNGLVSVTGVM